jgi:CheY-like chemotaxis protein
LNLILGMIELLQINSQDKKTFDYLKNMQSASEHLLNLITDLLSMSKEDASDVKINIAPINLPIFFEEIAFIIGPECRKKNLAFQMHISHDLPAQLSGDPVKIRQILLNLLRNSLKYTNSGKLSLNVELVKKSPTDLAPLCHLRFEVKDTGVGIPKGKMNLIFDRFFQIEDSKMLAEGGVGLGLSIVKDLVSKMHGNIVVKSELGKGSTFTVELDLECRDEQIWINQYQLVRSNLTRLALICDTKEQTAVITRLLPQKIFSVTDIIPEEIASSAHIAEYDQYVVASTSRIALKNLRDKIGDKKIILIADDPGLTADSPHKNTQLIDNLPILSSKLFDALDFKAIKKKSSLPTEAEQLQIKTQKTISILAVDDDAGNRELLKAYLNDPQFKVEFAGDGKEAFLLFVNNKPDLVIADLRMPIMNGFELAEAIKNYETENMTNGIATPIILLTADALENTSNEAKNYAISKFLTKPIRRTKLLNAIHETYNEFYS